MPEKYTSHLELKNKTLQQGDEVIFKINKKRIVYHVESTYLYRKKLPGRMNAQIFTELKINNEHAFCSKIYGYEDEGGHWPESEYKDYEALTRLTIELLKMCRTTPEKEARVTKKQEEKDKEIINELLLQ